MSLLDRIRTWETRRTVLATAAVLVAVQLVFRGWAVYGAWFHIDDFNYISRMLNDGRGLRAASVPYFGHVMPAGMYVSWLLHVLGPWNWALPATALLLLQLVADIGCVVVLVRIFGVRWGILPPLCLYLFSAINMPVMIWWAAAINQIPLQIALFFSLAAHVSYLRTRRLRHAWVCVAWLAFGLAFDEKTVLVYGLLVLFTLCWFATGRGWRRVREAVVPWWPGLTLYVVSGLVYAATYLSVQTGLSPGERQGYPTLGVVGNMVLHSYLPGVVGGPTLWLYIPDQPGSVPEPTDAVMYTSLVVVVLLLREVRRCRSGWARALLLPAFFLACDIGLVLAGRASFVGSFISLDYRYQGELPAVTAIALGCLALPVLGARETVAVREHGELLGHPRRIAVVTAAVALLATYSSVLYVGHWQADHQAERYIGRLTGELAAARDPVTLVDSPVPEFVTNGLSYPQNLIGHVLRGTHGARFPTTSTDHLSMVTDGGRIVPAGVPATRRPESLPAGSCGFRIRDRPRTIALDGPLRYGGWWVRIGYLSSADSPVTVTTGTVTRHTSVQAGLHALYVKAAGSFDSITVSGLQGSATLCTDDVTVGRPEPVESSP